MYGATNKQRDELAKLTDGMIEGWAPGVVRKVAGDLLEEDVYRTVVARVTLSDALVGHNGAMTAVDTVLSVLMQAYGDSEPKRVVQYGEVQVTTRNDDASIRSSLKYYAGRARKEIEEQAARDAEEITASLDAGNG